MYKIFLPLLLLLPCTLLAQNKAEIKGLVTDSISKQPVEMVTVAVLNARDTTASALISYAQSDQDGLFTVHNLPINTALKVVISFVGYRPYVKFFKLIKGQTLNMATVLLSPHQLNEVVIRAERMPITISKDTIEFDATAFKTRPNAMVEDLLKKLPGVEVDNRGKITVMGKDVTKILVDGREFFASDPRIASKNLDADLIAKVQVYDDREQDPNHVIPDDEVKKIINLKFKRELKKSIFGKVYAGSGTNDHYQTGGLFNMFRDTLQVSLLGYTNNLNSTGFDISDLRESGGVNRGGDAFEGLGYGGSGGNGKQTATAAGANINTDYGKKLKVNLNYVYKHNYTSYNTLTNRQQFLNDTTVTTGSISDRFNTTDTHSITSAVFWKPSEATQYRYNPSLNINMNNANNAYSSNSYSNFINPINNAVNSGRSFGNNIQFNQTFSYFHYLKKKESTLNITHSFSYNPGNNGHNFDNQNLVSYLGTLPSYTLMRLGEDQSRNASGSVAANYRNKLSKKVTFDVTANTDFNNSLNKTSTYDYNPVTGEYDSFLLTLSSDLNRISWKETVNPGITYNVSKSVSIITHLSTQFQQVNNIFQRNSPNLNQTFFNVLPVVSLRINSINIGYNRYMQLPNIGDMIPYSIVYSPLYTVTGNPGLQPTVSDRFNIGYFKFNFQSGTSFNLNANFSLDHNSVYRQRTINSQLVETSMPINRNGKYSTFLYAGYNKQLKKEKGFQINTSTNASINQSHDFYLINHQDGFQNSYRSTISERLSFNWDDVLEFSPKYTLSHVYTTYSGVTYNNQANLTHIAETHFVLYFPKKFNLEGNYDYRYNPQVAPGYQRSSNLLSLNLAHQFLKKDRGEIKLSCYDILNQNISNFRYINENIITDTESQIIKRYFMLTLQFRFNKSTLKGDEKPANKTKQPAMLYPMGGLMGH